MSRKFSPGAVVSTPGALKALEASDTPVMEVIVKHLALTQGELCDEDHQLNLEAVENGERIMSSFKLSDGTAIWVITEADRSSTCILLPEEY